MLKIIKYLKPFIFSILLVIGLLFVQALSDLTLPDYTANIVNVGIQQSGIENAVPKIIRKSEFEKLLLFIKPADQKTVKEHYTLLDKADLTQSELSGYLRDYPLLEKEPLYQIKTSDKKAIENLNGILGKPILIVSGIEKQGRAKGDPFAIMKRLPEKQRKVLEKKMNEKLQKMPGSMITQAAVPFIRREYQRIGVNVNQLQSRYILTAGAFMLLIALIGATASIIVGLLAARVAAGQGRNLRKDVFEKVTAFSISEFDQFSTASLITRSTNDIQQIQMLMVMLLRIVFYAPILGIGGVIKVINTDTSMGWIIGVALGAILALVIVLFTVAMPRFKRMQKLTDRLNLVTREFLTGILVIRAFNNENFEEKKFAGANADLTGTALFINRLMSMMMPVMLLIMNGITLLIVWVGAHQVDAGNMQVGDLMAFIQYTMQIIMAFLMISMVSIMLPRASVSAQRLAEVLDAKVSIENPRETKPFHPDKKGLLEFKDVFFRYPGADEDVLSDITFTARPGEVTALIGSTGSGKTTLVNLIPRFFDVTGGKILIAGTDIRDVSLHELRDKIGYVPQRGVLFSGTIESNIKYGNQSAGAGELMEAADIAQATGFIRSKPDEFDTEIAQGGTNVSGGQKQRLAITRALIKKPDIYIFDDSFSALDYRTDAALRKALRTKIKTANILIIAQRITSIKNADQIIVLDEGRIVGIGTHRDLISTCEVYQQIAFSQLSREELEG